MIVFFYFLIVIINAIAFLTKKTNRIIAIASSLFVVLFAIGKRIDGTPLTHDMESYERKYEYADELLNPVEFSFRGINLLGNKLGLCFEDFYMVVTLFIICLLLYLLYRLKSNVHLFLVVYLLYFVNITIGQMRNQCAMVTMFCLLPWAINYNNFSISYWNKMKLLLSIILASSFHASFLVYTLPFLAANEKKFEHLKSLGIFLLTAFAALFFLRQVSIIQLVIMLFISDTDYLQDRFGDYAESSTGLVSLVISFIYALSLIGLYYWRKEVIFPMHNIKKEMFSNYIFNVSLWSCVFLPLLLLDATFYRYLRDISFLALICMGIGITPQLKRKTLYKLFLFSISVPVCWFVFDIIIKGYWDDYSKHFFDTIFL